jgi:hypothetical protein
MVNRQQLLRSGAIALTLMTFVVSLPHDVSAQSDARSSSLGDAVKGTLLDPTTYAPALVGYDSTIRDWKTSQPFFQNGFVEHNARFTVTGLPDDTPISYGAGRNKILKDALATLEMSVVYNLSDRFLEHALAQRYPEHRRMVRAIGWVGRISLASVISYQLSAPHYQQWRQNQERAARLGF